MFPPGHGYRNIIPIYTGPYIEYRPDIQVHKLTKNDKYLVLASDGLWDEIKRKDTPLIAERFGSDSEKLAVNLFDVALENI